MAEPCPGSLSQSRWHDGGRYSLTRRVPHRTRRVWIGQCGQAKRCIPHRQQVIPHQSLPPTAPLATGGRSSDELRSFPFVRGRHAADLATAWFRTYGSSNRFFSPVAATATPVPATAAEQQHENDDYQDHFHGRPPFKGTRGRDALPSASALICAPLPSWLPQSGSGRDHRDDSVRAGVYDKNIIADQDVFIVAVLRGVFHDPRRQPVKVNCPWDSLADRDRRGNFSNALAWQKFRPIRFAVAYRA